MIHAEHSREAPNVDATENAISALIKIARMGDAGVTEGACGRGVRARDGSGGSAWPSPRGVRFCFFFRSPADLIPKLAEWLPITSDDEVAGYTYDYVSVLVEK